MPLKMTLESQDWLMIGDTKVVNIYPGQAKISIDGAAPILRGAHVMHANEADTAAKRAYLAVQRLYLGATTVMSEYQLAASELLRDSPESKEVVLKANIQLSKGAVYGALREYRKLIDIAQ